MDPHVLVVLVLVGVSGTGFVAAPHLLAHRRWTLRWPQLCLTLWYALFSVGLLSTVAALGVAVSLGIAARRASETHGWMGPTADTVTAWVALMVTGALLSLVGTKIAAMVVAERAMRADFRRLTMISDSRPVGSGRLSLHVVPSADVVVCSLRSGAGGGAMLITSSVADTLGAGELRALIEHESAHLRGFHDLATRLAALNAACLPGFLTPRRMSRTTALLIEVIADRKAVRATSLPDMTTALTRLADLSGDDTLRLRAALLAA